MAPGPILLNSVPKAGTHLLAKAFRHCLEVDHSDIHLNDALEAARAARSTPVLPKIRPLYALNPEASPVVRAQLLGIAPGPAWLLRMTRAWGPDALARVAAALPGPPRRFATGHLPYTPELADLFVRLDVRAVLLFRDPRDLVVSHVLYVRSQKEHRLHRVLAALSEHDAISAAIRGLPGAELADVGTLYRRFLAWRDCPQVRLTRFEHLVGARGGGSAEVQRREIAALARHVGVACGEAALGRAEELFGGTPTFREGRIGGGRERLTAAHLAAIDEVAGDVVAWSERDLATA